MQNNHTNQTSATRPKTTKRRLTITTKQEEGQTSENRMQHKNELTPN